MITEAMARRDQETTEELDCVLWRCSQCHFMLKMLWLSKANSFRRGPEDVSAAMHSLTTSQQSLVCTGHPAHQMLATKGSSALDAAGNDRAGDSSPD